ncbi:hypothetical protein AB0K27_12900, partial [Micromonospora echinospora]|uniref:hypothetical protein n=1 Tax=Micromonospora echinospora TaxID=1877 RepID=UPI00342ADD70
MDPSVAIPGVPGGDVPRGGTDDDGIGRESRGTGAGDCHHRAGQLRQRTRQQAVLERGGDVVLGLVELG